MKVLRQQRGLYNLSLSFGCSEYVMGILDRLHMGRYRWPIGAANDRDHIKW
jgi:hypothetical protein